jgi:hypothetical protein
VLAVVSLLIPLAVTSSAAVTDLTISPTSDSAPAGSCNAFTVTLTGNGQTSEVTGQTVDVRVADTDFDDTNTFGDESRSPVRFCTPAAADGPNPQPTKSDPGTIKDTPTDYNNAPPGDDGSIQGETCCTTTGAASPSGPTGEITFGIVSNVAGHYSVQAFYDEPGDNESPGGGEPQATATKTFTGAQSTNQCQDGVDNDGDGSTDYPNDPGCTSNTDNDESNPVTSSQCSDSLDNDGDGHVDFPADTGCGSASDNDETNGPGKTRENSASTISILYNHKHFKGSVSNQYKKCRVSRKVVLKRAKKGNDPTIAKALTDSNGNYSIRRAKSKVRGKSFYTKAKPKSFTKSDGTPVTCLKSRSPKLTF